MSRPAAGDGHQTPPRPPAYASVAEAVGYTRLSTRTLRRAIASGALPVDRVGRRVLISYDALDRFIAGKGATSPGPSEERTCPAGEGHPSPETPNGTK